MKLIYTAAFMLLFVSCSKDVLRSYDRRIVGTWTVIDVDRYGFRGEDNLPFTEDDAFVFSDDGGLTISQGSNTYSGSWDIQRMNDGDRAKKSLYINAVNFTAQQMRSEYFNDVVFTNTNRFTGFINYNSRVYVYRFLRQ